MKKLITSVICITFSLTMFASPKISYDDPLFILTSCGDTFVADDEGMSDEEIFDLTEAMDFMLCDLPNLLAK